MGMWSIDADNNGNTIIHKKNTQTFLSLPLMRLLMQGMMQEQQVLIGIYQ
jgi:hypothetical protein